MSDEKTITQGDLSRPILARAFDETGFIDLTLFTGGITFKMVGPTTITGTAVGDAIGNLTYTFTAGQTATVGDYVATFRGVDGSGKAQTFPEGTRLRVRIIAAL